MYKPTKIEIAAAINKTIPDVIAPGLSVLFCGINPGLYTAAVGHHFGRPGNRFWKVLFAAGFTPRLFHPSDQSQLLELGYGITNVVSRATTAAAELSKEEFVEGGKKLEKNLKKYQPKVLALLGIEAYRKAFDRPKAKAGKQDEMIAGVPVWVLPNPSGLNAGYRFEEMVELFKELKASSKKHEE